MISNKDMKILAHLRKDARMTLTKMSRKINVPVSTIYDRIRHHNKGLVKKYTALVDFPSLGYNTRANVMFKTGRQCKDQMRDYLVKHPNVNNVYRINSGFDFMIECVFRHVKEMEDFLEVLDERFDVLDKKSYYVIDDIKREEFMANSYILSV